MTSYSIEMTGLVKKFDSFQLGPLDLKVPKGSVVGYIGENGAGKTTTIKLLLGLLHKDQGDLKILGEANLKDVEIKDRIGVVFDDLPLPGEVNLGDVEKFCSRVYKNWDGEVFYRHIKNFHLLENQALKGYSRGMKMKLAMAIALSHQADLLVLDEATSGLDPVAREEILDLLLDYIQDENHTVLLSSHILSDLDKVADYIAFIHQGQVLFMEEKEELKEKYGLCSLSKEEARKIKEEAIVGRRVHAFGEDLLVQRDLVEKTLHLDKPTIEDIMVYFVRGKEA